MINPVNDLNRNPFKDTPSKPADRAVGRIDKGFDAFPATDSVNLQPGLLLNVIRNQIGNLKKELPGIISDALLGHGNHEAIRKSPITALIFRLVKPLQAPLGTANKLSEDQILGLREEIQKFKEDIPALQKHALLAPFLSDSDQSIALNEILSGLASQLDGIIHTFNQSLSS